MVAIRLKAKGKQLGWLGATYIKQSAGVKENIQVFRISSDSMRRNILIIVSCRPERRTVRRKKAASKAKAGRLLLHKV